MVPSSTVCTIVEMVAREEAVEPTELDPPLADAVDPDTLDLLCVARDERTNAPGTAISFEYRGHLVTVDPDGRVSLDGAVEEP